MLDRIQLELISSIRVTLIRQPNRGFCGLGFRIEMAIMYIRTSNQNKYGNL
jgi:hypothetical protein